MEEPNPSSIYRVTDEETASLLLNRKMTRALKPFMNAKRSIVEAGREIAVDVVDLYPHVKRFVDAKLIEAVDEVPRSGRATKLYQAVAESFFIPFALKPVLAQDRKLGADDHKRFTQGWESVWLDYDLRGLGLLVFKQPDGRLARGITTPQGQMWHATSEDGPIALTLTQPLRLGREEALALHREMYDLMARYSKVQEGDEVYLTKVEMVPRADVKR